MRTGSTHAQAGKRQLSVILVKPSHYDDDGYVIQWFRSAVPSNSLPVMHGLMLDCQARQVLGSDVAITIRSMDEDNTRIRTGKLVEELTREGQLGLAVLVGVQSNQFPRAMDIARPLRAVGIAVCLCGFHVSGSLSMLGGVTPEPQEAIDLGISLFAGEAEEHRVDQVLRDAWNGELKPLYNYLDDLPSLEGAPTRCCRRAQFAAPSASTLASMPGADARFSATSAPSSTYKGESRGGAGWMKSSRLFAQT